MSDDHESADENDRIVPEDIDIADPTNLPHPHRDGSLLRYLYWEEGLTQAEIADRLDVSQGTVANWMEKNNINTRVGYGTVTWDEKPPEGEYSIRPDYEHKNGGDRWNLGVHQILALADHPPEEVFDEGTECHHRLPMYVALNVSENIAVMPSGEHRAILHPDGPDGDVTPEEAETATSLDEIGWRQSGVSLDAIRGLHGSTVPVTASAGDASEEGTDA